MVAVFVVSIALRVPDALIDAAGISSPPLQVMLVVAVLAGAASVVSLPADLMLMAHRRAWNMRAPKPLWREAGGDLAMSFVAGPFFMLPIWALIRVTSLWWLVLSAVIGFVVLVAKVAQPRFSRHEVVRDDHIVNRVRRLAKEAGVSIIDVCVRPPVRDARRPDNYLVGVGRRSRIVLASDVFERPIAEIEVLLARTIAGWKKQVPVRRTASVAVALSLMFLPSHLVLSAPVVQRWADFAARDDPRAIPVLLVVFVPSFMVVNLLMAWRHRREARRLDIDALEFTRNVDAFQSVVRAIHARELTDLAPSSSQRLRSYLPAPVERLEMAERWRRSRRVAVLFTDIEDSTLLTEQLGDEGWYELLQDHNDLLRRHVAEHGGRETGSAGDGFLFVFEDAGAALLCAIEVQQSLRTLSAEHSGLLRVRMGVHSGEVIRKGEGVIGREVHVAARIAAAAAGEQIFVSGEVRDLLSDSGRFRFGPGMEMTLKGLSGTHRVYEVDWRQTALVGFEFA